MKVRYADGTETEIGTSLSSVEVSPDGTRLLYNQGFTWEGAGTLWVCDFESREKRQLSLDGLRDMYTPAFADWLDDRYILFVEQFASGTTVMGGDLCVCCLLYTSCCSSFCRSSCRRSSHCCARWDGCPCRATAASHCSFRPFCCGRARTCFTTSSLLHRRPSPHSTRSVSYTHLDVYKRQFYALRRLCRRKA